MLPRRRHPKEDVLKAICRLAKTKNKKELAALLEGEKISVSANFGSITAIEILAFEGEIEAVDFLIQEFEGDVTFAALGFARRGDVIAANDLKKYGADPLRILMGHCIANNPEAIDKEIKAAAHDNELIREVVMNMVTGYALGGHIEEVNWLLSEEVKRGRTVQELFHFTMLAIVSFAIIGRFDLNELLICELLIVENRVLDYQHQFLTFRQWVRVSTALGATGFGDFDKVLRLLPFMAQHQQLIPLAINLIAFSGCDQKLFEFLELHPNRTPEAITGAASGGHEWIVDTLIERSNDNKQQLINLAIEYYEKHRHIRQSKKLLSAGADINAALKGASQGYHLNEMHCLIMNGADTKYAIEGLTAIWKKDDITLLTGSARPEELVAAAARLNRSQFLLDLAQQPAISGRLGLHTPLLRSAAFGALNPRQRLLTNVGLDMVMQKCASVGAIDCINWLLADAANLETLAALTG
jgi:hypothetical protein